MTIRHFSNRLLLLVTALLLFCITQAQADPADTILKSLLTPKQLPAGATVVGNPKGNVSLIEFTDFNCPYCKLVAPIVASIAKKDKRLRVVVVDYPVISPTSALAASAALSARAQGKYFQYHNALMKHQGNLTQTSLISIATQQGLNVKKLQAAMQSKTIKQAVNGNLHMGMQLGIPGTPAFIVAKTLLKPGQTLSNTPKPILSFGYMSYKDMQSTVRKMRRAKA